MVVPWLGYVLGFALLVWCPTDTTAESTQTHCDPLMGSPDHIMCQNGRHYRVLLEEDTTLRNASEPLPPSPGAHEGTGPPVGPGHLVKVQCTRHGATIVECVDGQEYRTEEILDTNDPKYWECVIIAITLVTIAGIMSGLQLGLLSIDYNTLVVLMAAGEPHERINAAKIEPLVKRRHLLLVTLLVSNACCLEALPLFLDKIMTPFANILISVTAVLFFGEIIPQSICVRHGMAIGAFMSPIVWLVIGITFPISYPLSKLLDAILGHGEATFFRRGELKELVLLQQQQGMGEEKLTEDETTIIRGALEMTMKTVKDCMTPIEKVFMLDLDGVLDTAAVGRIQENGHSRIPIYHKVPNNIVGMILVKDLLSLDPRDATPMRQLPIRKLPTVTTRKPLYETLNLFQTGNSHLAEVVDAVDCVTIVGVVTLEDVIEELIGEEIEDETDERTADDRQALQCTQLGRLTQASMGSGLRTSSQPGSGLRTSSQPGSGLRTSSQPGRPRSSSNSDKAGLLQNMDEH